MILRIDDIVSGMKKPQNKQQSSAPQEAEQETFGDTRDG
jgi:hypothetical protein